jgi:hypothetical protein
VDARVASSRPKHHGVCNSAGMNRELTFGAIGAEFFAGLEARVR